MTVLTGRTALVLGGAQGIGSATAIALSQAGARVWVGDLRLPDDASCSEIAYEQMDATCESEVYRVVNNIVATEGRIDVLVNNVGRGWRSSILDTTIDDFYAILDANLKSAFIGCRTVLPHMLKQESGSIVNMSSNGGLIGRSNDPVYSAAKHAVIGLTKSLAVRYAQSGVRVNAVCPGPIDTPAFRRGADTKEEFEEKLPSMLSSCPAARVGRASEVADAVVFLSGDSSSFVTGVSLAVDGGKAAGIMPDERYNLEAVTDSLP